MQILCIRATHSGILTSVNSTAAYATVSPLTQRSPPKDLSIGTLSEGQSQVLVLVVIEGNLVPKSGWIRDEKSCVYI